MTILNNIMSLLPAAAPKGAPQVPGQALGQGTPTLSDFLGMILSLQAQGLEPNGQPGLQGQKLPLSPADMKALGEKIAAILNKDPSAAPESFAAPLAPAMTRDFSTALATHLQNAAPPAADAGTGTALQNGGTSPEPAATAEMTGVPAEEMAHIAALLNGLEPGASAASAESGLLQQPVTPQDAQAIIAFLQAEGFPGAQPPIPSMPAAEMAANNAAAPQQTGAMPVTGQKATAAAPVISPMTSLQGLLQAQATPETALPEPVPMPATAKGHDAPPPGPLPAPMPAPAPQAPAQQQQPSPASAAQNLLQNLMAQQDTGGFDADGFGQNNFFFHQGAPADASASASAGGMTQGADALPPGFAHYAAAAGRGLPPQAAQMIALHMQRNAAAKVDTFTLQLEPADLGRLDIELTFKHDGSIKAHLTAERPETFMMLQKDSHQLERLLQQAGFDADEQSLSFDLRQQGQQHDADGMRGKQAPATGIRTGGADIQDNSIADAAEAQRALSGHIGARGVNIMV